MPLRFSFLPSFPFLFLDYYFLLFLILIFSFSHFLIFSFSLFSRLVSSQVKDVVDYKTGMYDIVLTIKKIGVIVVQKIESDGREVQGAPFNITVRRNYSAIAQNQIQGQPIPNATFKGVWGIAVDTRDNVYVVDTDEHSVLVFDSERQTQVRRITCKQEGATLPFPRGVTITSNDEVAVVCNNLGRVQIFGKESDNQPIEEVGEVGNGPAQLQKPRGICLGPKNELVVVDTNNHRLQKINVETKQFQAIGARGKNPHQYFFPASVAFFKDTYVVSDCDNHRVSLAKGDGATFNVFGGNGKGDGEFGRPTGVAVDAFGNIFVADMDNNRIQVFDSKGTFITKFGDSQLNGPRGVAVDSTGKVFVADFGNGRVVAF